LGFFLRYRIQTGFGAHPTSYLMAFGASSPIFMAWHLIKHRNNFAFFLYHEIFMRHLQKCTDAEQINQL
jgi:hypothetical protein